MYSGEMNRCSHVKSASLIASMAASDAMVDACSVDNKTVKRLYQGSARREMKRWERERESASGAPGFRAGVGFFCLSSGFHFVCG